MMLSLSSHLLEWCSHISVTCSENLTAHDGDKTYSKDKWEWNCFWFFKNRQWMERDYTQIIYTNFYASVGGAPEAYGSRIDTILPTPGLETD